MLTLSVIEYKVHTRYKKLSSSKTIACIMQSQNVEEMSHMMDTEYNNESEIDPKTLTVARRIVRFILASIESQSTILTKNKLQNVIRDILQQENSPRIPFNTLVGHINDILGDVFGYQMQRLTTKGEKFIIVNKLPALECLNGLNIDKCVGYFNEWPTVDTSEVSHIDILDETLHKQDLAFKGLLSVILCIVIFSKNHILQQELLTQLQSFGIPTDGTNIPIINWNIDELLKTMDKREYLTRIQDNSDLQGDTIYYRLGRRTQVEFDLNSLVQLVRTVMGLSDDQHPSLKDDIIRNIGDSYKSNVPPV